MTTQATVGECKKGPEPDAKQAVRLVQRIRAEYVEMPGLALTVPQAARLWNLPLAQSQQVLSQLTGSKFLMRDARGAYRRSGCPRCS